MIGRWSPNRVAHQCVCFSGGCGGNAHRVQGTLVNRAVVSELGCSPMCLLPRLASIIVVIRIWAPCVGSRLSWHTPLWYPNWVAHQCVCRPGWRGLSHSPSELGTTTIDRGVQESITNTVLVSESGGSPMCLPSGLAVAKSTAFRIGCRGNSPRGPGGRHEYSAGLRIGRLTNVFAVRDAAATNAGAPEQ